MGSGRSSILRWAAPSGVRRRARSKLPFILVGTAGAAGAALFLLLPKDSTRSVATTGTIEVSVPVTVPN